MHMYSIFFLFFFFSSRRRHTRSLRDWSSDVCSSDLAPAAGVPPALTKAPAPPVSRSSDMIRGDRKSTRLNSSHVEISYAVFCLKKKKTTHNTYNNDNYTANPNALSTLPPPSTPNLTR